MLLLATIKNNLNNKVPSKSLILDIEKLTFRSDTTSCAKQARINLISQYTRQKKN